MSGLGQAAVILPPDEFALSSAECDVLLAEAEAAGWVTKRPARPVMTYVEGAVAQRLARVAATVNASLWALDVDGSCWGHALRYPAGSMMPWHRDRHPYPAELQHLTVSAATLLSDPAEFEGGVLQIRDGAGVVRDLSMTRGAVAVFPATLEHQVTTVTGGVRLSANVFLSGGKR